MSSWCLKLIRTKIKYSKQHGLDAWATFSGTPCLMRQQPEGRVLCTPWIASQQKKPSFKELRSFSKSPEGDIFLLKRTANVLCALAASVKGCWKPLLRTRAQSQVHQKCWPIRPAHLWPVCPPRPSHFCVFLVSRKGSVGGRMEFTLCHFPKP